MLAFGEMPKDSEWLFYLVFDYGERSHSLNDVPAFTPGGSWLCRPDCTSRYGYGFEIRTRRLCHQILMYHRLEALGGTERVILQSVCYSAVGQVLEEVHGNGVVTTYTYEAETQRLTGIKTARPASHSSGAKVLQDLRYKYDPVGNVVSVNNDAEATRFWRNQKVVPESRYVYDSLYQLVSATGREMAGAGQQSSMLPDVTLFDNATYTNYTRTWTYDSNGNLTQMRHSAPATGNNHTTNITVSNRSNRGVISDLAEHPGNVEALFSAGGHQLQLQAGQVLHWTLREELHRVTLVDREESSDEEVYRYNADAKRVVKTRTQLTGNSTQTDEVVYLEGLELRNTYRGVVQTAELTVSMAGKARLLHWVSGKPENIRNDQIRYSHGSLNENCSLETDENGLLISLEEYYPFGGTAVWAARGAVEAEYKTIRYSGKERDVTGLYYYGYRYYQAWSGRWLSADPAGTIDGLNLFRMCRNNPVTYRDPVGLDPDSEEDTVATLFTPEKLELSPHVKNILDAKAQQKEGKEKKQYNILFISAKKNKNSFDPRSSDSATTEFSRQRMSYLMHKGHNVKGAYANTVDEFTKTWNAIGKGSLKDINKVIIDYHGSISPKRGHESVLVLSTDPQALFDRKDIESLEEKSTVDVVSLAACYSGFVEKFNPAVGFLDKLTKPGAYTVGFDAQGDNDTSKMKTVRHTDPGALFTNALSALNANRLQYGRVKYKKTSDNQFQIDYKPGFKEMSKDIPRSQYFNY